MMIHRPKPHSTEWFDALQRFNSHQASHTAHVIKLAGSDEVCGICGDQPARDYEIVEPIPVEGSVATYRLCDDCLTIRNYEGEGLIPFRPAA